MGQPVHTSSEKNSLLLEDVGETDVIVGRFSGLTTVGVISRDARGGSDPRAFILVSG